MRALWMPSPLSVFSPNVALIKAALPDAAQLSFRFPARTVGNRKAPDVAQEMSVRFRNGQTLTVPGHMLWRFRDMIPAQLGDEQSGYTDTNPFTAEHGSALMERVRRAHDAAYGVRREAQDLFGKILVSATIDLPSGKVALVHRPSLSVQVSTDLALQFMAAAADSRKSTIQAMAAVVEAETSRPRLRLENGPARGGYISRQKTRSPWPDLALLPFDQYRHELSETTWPDSPAQMKQSDLLDVVLFSQATDIVGRMLKDLRQHSPLYASLCHELGLPSTAGPQRLATALARSDFEFVPGSLLWVDASNALEELSVAEVIKRRADSWWLRLTADDRHHRTPEAASQPRDPEHLSDRIAAVMHTYESGRRRKVFRMVCKLWLFHDIDPSTSPHALPQVTHSLLDFDRLRRQLQESFRYGPAARLRVANDTIDIPTVGMRHAAHTDMSFDDYGEILLERSRKTDEGIIGVQQAWAPLQEFKHRDLCPPPAVIMFVVESHNWEDAILWLDQSRMIIGVRRNMGTNEEADHIGKLPQSLHQTIEQIFKVKYETRCLLDRGPTDTPPPQYRF